ncbi:hypothetical protein LCGC14_2368010 [marine sediment metagenome]|uniref:Uncharacterized protein n=1 Tax=marine sediment metagenome TaxID=412755 RepID=A0A0F9C4S6_9ZZZZ
MTDQEYGSAIERMMAAKKMIAEGIAELQEAVIQSDPDLKELRRQAKWHAQDMNAIAQEIVDCVDGFGEEELTKGQWSLLGAISVRAERLRGNAYAMEFFERYEKKVKPGLGKRIVLCGSTKFKQAFEEWNARLTLEGHIVYSVGLFAHADNLPITDEQKSILDHIHRVKISASGEIFVLDVGGYIGESTAAEIEFAEKQGKMVRYLSKEHPGWTEDDCTWGTKG